MTRGRSVSSADRTEGRRDGGRMNINPRHTESAHCAGLADQQQQDTAFRAEWPRLMQRKRKAVVGNAPNEANRVAVLIYWQSGVNDDAFTFTDSKRSQFLVAEQGISPAAHSRMFTVYRGNVTYDRWRADRCEIRSVGPKLMQGRGRGERKAPERSQFVAGHKSHEIQELTATDSVLLMSNEANFRGDVAACSR